ncbi:Peptidase S8/S53 domain [Sesbania bispinosa]|nr:Peptidase S8/S53 domain [Sesbania bispinosa]
MAPGIDILAAMKCSYWEKAIFVWHKIWYIFGLPSVTGAAAFIKSVHRRWNPSMIKSALMTTATTYNYMKKPLTNSSNHFTNPHEMGAGENNPLRALNPDWNDTFTLTRFQNRDIEFLFKAKRRLSITKSLQQWKLHFVLTVASIKVREVAGSPTLEAAGGVSVHALADELGGAAVIGGDGGGESAAVEDLMVHFRGGTASVVAGNELDEGNAAAEARVAVFEDGYASDAAEG